MTATDPIADLITQLKHASAAGKEFLTVSHSTVKLAIAELLAAEGYVTSIEKHGRKARKLLVLGVPSGAVRGVRRVSKPSRRVYRGASELRSVRQGHGVLVVSTPEGILSGAAAKKRGIGGETLFEIW